MLHSINAILTDKERKLTTLNILKQKIAQAQSDKIELMRDQATYESNFSDTISLRSGMLKLHKELL